MIAESSLLLLLWLSCIAACDLRHRRVPNLLVLAGAVLALLVLALGRQPLGVDWSGALLAGSVAFAALLIFYGLGLMGAADVKFAAALGLWLGPWPMLWVWIGASLLAAGHALALMAWRRHTGLPRTRKREIPYAAHLAIVTMAWMFGSHLFP